MAAGGGGAWKVAYADFVTAMMAFFMVMWLVGQNDKAKEAVAKHFRSDPLAELWGDDENVEGGPLSGVEGGPVRGGGDPRGRAERGPMRGHGRFGVKRGESAKVPSPSDSEQDPETLKPRLLTLHDSERTSVGAVLPFAGDTIELSEEAKQRLDDLLPKLVGKPHKIEVRGHCSAQGPADKHSNEESWKLTYARSLATMRYLEEKGIPSERIRLSQAGQFEPFTLEEASEKQVRNERVEVYLLNEFTSDLQGTRKEREKRFWNIGAASTVPH
jgi:chemotaxis protein MotB